MATALVCVLHYQACAKILLIEITVTNAGAGTDTGRQLVFATLQVKGLCLPMLLLPGAASTCRGLYVGSACQPTAVLVLFGCARRHQLSCWTFNVVANMACSCAPCTSTSGRNRSSVVGKGYASTHTGLLNPSAVTDMAIMPAAPFDYSSGPPRPYRGLDQLLASIRI